MGSKRLIPIETYFIDIRALTSAGTLQLNDSIPNSKEEKTFPVHLSTPLASREMVGFFGLHELKRLTLAAWFDIDGLKTL